MFPGSWCWPDSLGDELQLTDPMRARLREVATPAGPTAEPPLVYLDLSDGLPDSLFPRVEYEVLLSGGIRGRIVLLTGGKKAAERQFDLPKPDVNVLVDMLIEMVKAAGEAQ
jgi:hypothetical protein